MKKIIILLALLALVGCTDKKVICGDFDTGWSTDAYIFEGVITWYSNGSEKKRALPEGITCIVLKRESK